MRYVYLFYILQLTNEECPTYISGRIYLKNGGWSDIRKLYFVWRLFFFSDCFNEFCIKPINSRWIFEWRRHESTVDYIVRLLLDILYLTVWSLIIEWIRITNNLKYEKNQRLDKNKKLLNIILRSLANILLLQKDRKIYSSPNFNSSQLFTKTLRRTSKLFPHTEILFHDKRYVFAVHSMSYFLFF